ncbi:MAG: 6-phosphogluconolactonase [Candidatus Pacebacteria bacterium]|nr:6-phosphogluconolactonase [Candidatus Paceibacterota bacterium]
MSLNIKTTTDEGEVANFVASAVLDKLQSGKCVLLFLTGGSSISIGVKIADILKQKDKNLLKNLVVTLTDERYGPVDHFNSNFFQLTEKGFSLPNAKIIPVLIDDDRNITTEKFAIHLNEEFTKAEYKIGLFGVGVDGHTAGILPNSEATHADKLAFTYDTATFSRITMTFKAIEKLDEAVVWMQGKEKWPIIEDLKTEIDIIKQPAQILKKVTLLTIFSDYKN